jgi:hypothetical protein
MEIYKITSLINNKIYIGKDTTSDPNYFGSGLLIKRAFEKYGRENFIKEVIDTTDDYNELSKKEIYWISYYNSTDRKIGYNISKGGDGGDTLSNHPELDLIREKISNNSYTKGRTYEEAFGEKRAKDYKKKLSESNTRHSLGKSYDDLYSLEKSENIKKIISNNTKASWDEERKKTHSKLAKDNILKSLLSESSIIKNREYLNERWSEWRENEFNIIKSLIDSSNIDNLTKYLEKIPNTLFNSRKEFYKFVGDENHNLIKKELLKRKKPHKNNEQNKKKVMIDGKNYDSISEASLLNNIEKSLIRYRLKSNNYPDYFYI